MRTNSLKPSKPTEEALQVFRTTSLPLGAVVLCEIPGAAFSGVDKTQSIDGKFVLKIFIPSQCVDHLDCVLREFKGRRILVPLWRYNLRLNELRDVVKACVTDGRGAV